VKGIHFSSITVRRILVGVATALSVAAASAPAPAAAKATTSARRAAAGTPGTSIGTAWPPLEGGTTYRETNFFTGYPENWYTFYKKADSTVAFVTVDNTSTDATCGYINATLQDQNGWTDSAVNGTTLAPGGSYTFAVPPDLAGDPQGRYYLWVVGDDNNCGPSGSATYTINLTPSAQFSNPGRAPNKAGRPGASIGDTWPPLRGGISYAHTNYFAGFPEDWYAVYKKPDSHTATVRIVNTSVYGASCAYLNVSLQDGNGVNDASLETATLNANSAVTFTLPPSLGGDPQGLYYVRVVGDDNDCGSPGSATYAIEPEPGSEFASPVRVATLAGHPGTSIGGAWPPLGGGVAYAHANYFTGYPEDWYAVYKKPDSHTATVRIANTSTSGVGCSYLSVELYNNHGTADPGLDSTTLAADGAATFTVPGRLSQDPQGLYYVVLQGDDNDCSDTGGASYTIEPEPGAQWGDHATALPAGVSRAKAKGPLLAGVTYAGSVVKKGAQDWSFFVAKGAATVQVQDTASSAADCKLTVAVGSSSAALASGQVTALHVAAAGRYYLELTPTAGCAPKSGLSALVKLSGKVTT
jgi:hypothetical protein